MKTTKQGNYGVKRQKAHRWNGHYFPEVIIVYKKISATEYRPIKYIA